MIDGRRAGFALLVVGLVVLLSCSLLWWPRTVDDAFITYRYADNLVAGNGPVFNAGERVEGYTCPSWLLLVAAAIAGGLDPVVVSKLAGLAASLLLLPLLFVALRRHDIPPWGAGLAALLLGSSMVLQIWSVSGMETNAYALLFFAGLVGLADTPLSRRRVVVVSTLLVAAALTRPEGLAYWVLGFGWILLTPGVVARRERADRIRTVAAYLLPGLVLAAHFAWRVAYYGRLLPNTYYVKTGGGAEMWAQGLHELRSFLWHPAHLPWVVAALAGAAFGLFRARRPRVVTIMGGAVLLHLTYVVSVGGDGLRIHRFYVAALPPLAFLVGLLFAKAPPRDRLAPWLRTVGVAAVVVASSSSLWALRTQLLPSLNDGIAAYQEGNVKLGRHLAARLSPDTWIAVPSAGATPYYSRLPTIDMYGLTDAHIAGVPFPGRKGGRMMKWDNDYVLSRRPEIIVINRGYFRAEDPLIDDVQRQPGMLAVSPMDRDLFGRVARDGSYTLTPLLLEDGSVFFVFLRIGR